MEKTVSITIKDVTLNNPAMNFFSTSILGDTVVIKDMELHISGDVRCNKLVLINSTIYCNEVICVEEANIINSKIVSNDVWFNDLHTDKKLPHAHFMFADLKPTAVEVGEHSIGFYEATDWELVKVYWKVVGDAFRSEVKAKGIDSIVKNAE